MTFKNNTNLIFEINIIIKKLIINARCDLVKTRVALWQKKSFRRDFYEIKILLRGSFQDFGESTFLSYSATEVLALLRAPVES